MRIMRDVRGMGVRCPLGMKVGLVTCVRIMITHSVIKAHFGFILCMTRGGGVDSDLPLALEMHGSESGEKQYGSGSGFGNANGSGTEIDALELAVDRE